MKNLILALPLLLGSGCGTLRSIAEVPVAVVDDVEEGVDVLTPGEQAVADGVGQAAGTTATVLTGGNVAIGGTVAVLATGLTAWFLKRRKK